jgi:hypothetical protein
VVEIFVHDPSGTVTYKRALDVGDGQPSYPFDVDIVHSTRRLETVGTTNVVDPDPDDEMWCYYDGVSSFPFHIQIEAYESSPLDENGMWIGAESETVTSTFVLPSGSQLDEWATWDFVSSVPEWAAFLEVSFSTSELHDPYYVDANFGYLYDVSDPGSPYFTDLSELQWMQLDAGCGDAPLAG